MYFFPLEEEVYSSHLKSQIQVWKVPLSQSQDVVNRFETILNSEEMQRAKRFHFDKDRKRYIVARGALRTILSEYLEVNPQKLQFLQGRFGKPYLCGLHADVHENRGRTSKVSESTSGASISHNLHFNLSHCEDLALVAVSEEHPLGVDVEKVREIGELKRIVERYFSEEEKAFLDSVQTDERPKALLTLWSRREATAKAFGLNLAAALSVLKVPVFPAGGSILMHHLAELETDTGEKRPVWSIRDLQLGEGHVGALCVEGSDVQYYYRILRYNSHNK